MSSYWGASQGGGGTYGKVKNSLTYNPNGNNHAANTSYVTYASSNVASNVSYPSSSYSKPTGKVTYYTQDWSTIKEAQYKATGKMTTRGHGRGGRGSYNNFNQVQALHYCEVCKITCGTSATYKAHIDGAKHIKKTARLDGDATEVPKTEPKTGTWECVLCDIISTSPEAFKAHINGSKHEKKVQLHKRLGKPVPDPVTPKEADLPDEKEKEKVGEEFVETKFDESTKRTIFFCTMCNCSFMDATAKEFHVLGRRHRLEYKKKHDNTIEVDIPASKRQKFARGRGRGGYRGTRRSEPDPEEAETYRQIWEAEQRQLELEWDQYREEERWYRYIDGIKRQEDDHRQCYIQERQRCESIGIQPPPPPSRPRPPPPPPARDNSRKMLDNQDNALIHQKHSQLQPSKSDVAALEKLMKFTEGVVDNISDELDKEHRDTPEYKKKKAAVKVEAVEEKMETAETKETKEGSTEESVETPAKVVEEVPENSLVIKSHGRIGDLPKHSLLKSYIEGSLVIFCVKKPTVPFFEKLFLKLKHRFAEHEDGIDAALASNVAEATIFIKLTEPVCVEVKVILTSAIMRDEEVNVKSIARDKSMKVLNRTACLNALASLRQTKWFESKMSVNLIVVLQLLKDLNKRIPAWSPLSIWSLELIVERCARTKGYSCLSPKFTPAEVLRRVFELFASGFLLLNSPGLNDPCEKDPVDVLGYLTAQEREDLTASAQYALRLVVFNQLYKILGIPQPDALKTPGDISRTAVPSTFKGKGNYPGPS